MKKLIVVRGKSPGQEFELQEGENLIGRWDPDASSFPEIDLDDQDDEAKISRKHAILFCSGDKIVVRDLGSRNGTNLRSIGRLEVDRDYELVAGDEIVLGAVVLRLI